MTRLVVTGSSGQVGWELVRTLQPLGQVTGLDRSQFDITDHREIRRLFCDRRPDVLINAAAYTAVDRAETEETVARAANADAVAELAALAGSSGCLLIHYSTDYVFNGQKAGAYFEDDAADPLSAYGRTKLLGEKALQASRADWLCLRTSWVYASRGRNFLRTIVRLAMEQEELRVVSDQYGAPTPARFIAEATAQITRLALQERLERRFRSQLLHLSAAGSTSWHGFAEAILQRMALSLMKAKAKRVVPISTEEFPTAAHRPANSRLCCDAIARRFALQIPSWESGLDRCFAELEKSGAVVPTDPAICSSH